MKHVPQRLVAVLILPIAAFSEMGATWAIAAPSPTSVGQTRPTAADIPEEILQTQIILDARSPLDGKPMTPAEYAELQAIAQAEYGVPAELSPKLVRLIQLLKLRRFIKRYLPIIPIK